MCLGSSRFLQGVFPYEGRQDIGNLAFAHCCLLGFRRSKYDILMEKLSGMLSSRPGQMETLGNIKEELVRLRAFEIKDCACDLPLPWAESSDLAPVL